MLNEKNQSPVYLCSAYHYNRHEHWWERDGMGRVIYHTQRRHPALNKVEKRFCPDHEKPVIFTAEELIEAARHYSAFSGWTFKTEQRTWFKDNAYPVAILISPDGITIEIWFSSDKKNNPRDRDWSKASGHTSFTTSQGTRTFDRRGVDDSFQLDWPDNVTASLDKCYAQVVKVSESRQRIDRSEPVPGLPFLVTPESRAEIIAKLKAGKEHQFMPSGFGTGYRLMTRPTCWGTTAQAVTAAFFGVPRLYLETMDCD